MKIEIIGRTNPVCKYCEQAKKDLTERGIEYVFIDVDQDNKARQKLNDLKLTTVPQLFHNNIHIGDSSVAKTYKLVRNITKRDGRVVEFKPSSINNMSEWAIKAAPDANWSSVVMTAMHKLPDGDISTTQIQQALIQACLDKEELKYNKVAGRLLLGDIRKSSLATLNFVEFYETMVETGYWRDMGYTKSDLVYLISYIDHDKDLDYSYTTFRQFNDKYFVKDENGVLLELPQYLYMGIAMSLFENDSLEDVISYYTKASEQKINIPTPVMSTQRTPSNVGVSCVITTAGDSLQGIATSEHIAFMATASSAGLGVEYDVRSPNDDVRHGYAKAGGKLPHYKVLDKIVKSVKQNNRGGSATVTYNVLDPELEILLNLKLTRTIEERRIDLMDYTLCLNNDFLRRAAKKEKWCLVSKRINPELHNSFYNDRDNFSFLMDEAIKSGQGQNVNAFDILTQFLINRQETGRIYMVNIDNVNNHTPFKDTVRLSNLCVAPETKILTKRGYKKIKDFCDERIDIWNGEEWSNVEIIKTGTDQKLTTVITNSGQSLTCTDYHKWYILDEYHTPYKEVRTKDLKIGDKLIKFDLPVIEGELELDSAYENGFFSGDGCDYKGKKIIYLYHEKRDLLPLFKSTHKIQNQVSQKRIVIINNNLLDKFYVPNSEYSIKSRLNWLSGYFDADGCIYINGTNEAINCCSINYSFLQEIQYMLQELGVSSKITKASDGGYKSLPKNDGTNENKLYNCKSLWRLLLTSCDTQKLLKLGLSFNRLKINKRTPQRDAKNFVTISEIVTNDRIDDTYCFTENKRHMGMFNGILTGQCLEVLLPTKPYNHITDLYKVYNHAHNGLTAQCFISAIDVARVVDDDDYKECCYIVAKSLDNLITTMNYPFKQFKSSANKFRSIGVGITNLSYKLVKADKTYKDVDYIHQIAERHYYFMLLASIRLAQERGAFELMNETKWDNKWLPIDTYNVNVDNITSTPLLYNWDNLRENIAFTGVRFSTLTCHMPCESSSLVSNAVNGLYPPREKLVYKNSRKGNIQSFLPDVDKYNYQMAWDINYKDLINCYAVIQKFNDQSISADTYTDFSKYKDNKIPLSETVNNFLYANKVGLKTLYYNNSKTGRGEITQKEESCENCSL